MAINHANSVDYQHCRYGFYEPQIFRYPAALAVVFCSASQDIVFDAYKTDFTGAEERGIGAANQLWVTGSAC